MHKVVLDTNVVISSVIATRGAPFAILEFWRKGNFYLVTSEDQIQEIRVTIQRPKFSNQYGVMSDTIQALERRLRRDAIVVQPRLPCPITVRDPDDEIILATAFAGSAEFLVTGDHDLLSLSEDPLFKGLGLLIQEPTAFAMFLSLSL